MRFLDIAEKPAGNGQAFLYGFAEKTFCAAAGRFKDCF